MAEFVQLRMEQFVPELEQMSRIGLFTEEEVRDVIKHRKEFEYKLQRHVKERKDFINYIDYEVKLIEEIRSRRRATGINEKKADIEYTISKRIIDLYKSAVQRFSDDLSIWYSFISFGTNVKFMSSVSRAITRMLQAHTCVPDVWRVAATWHKEHAASPIEARRFLTRGIQHNPDAVILYQDLFALEMDNVKMKFSKDKTKRKNEKNEIIEDEGKEEENYLRAAEIIFDMSMKSLSDELAFDFIIFAANVVERYHFAENLQTKIYDLLIERFPLYEKTWDLVARRELNKKDVKKIDQIENCIRIYESAVEQIPTEKMWSFFIDTVFNINGIDDMEKRKILFAAHHAGSSSGTSFLSEENYIQLLEMVEGVEKKDILVTATDIVPSSSMLWHERLEYFIENDDEIGIRNTIRQGTEALGELSFSLWKRKIEYLESKDGVESKTISEFKQALKTAPKPVMNLLIVIYIEFLAERVSRDAARKAYYEAIVNIPPLALHQKMYEIESNGSNACTKTCRRILETACEQFGKNEISVWIERIKFELKRSPLTVSRIYNEAIRTLDKKYLASFEIEFELIRNASD